MWPGDDRTYNFAVTMAGAGYPAICVDHLGTDNGKAPLIGDVVAANVAVSRVLLDELRKSRPGLRSISVGHSMGSALTVRQQARFCTHDALAVMTLEICGTHYPDINGAAPDSSMPEELAQAVRRHATPLLGVGGLLAMLFGSSARWVRTPPSTSARRR